MMRLVLAGLAPAVALLVLLALAGLLRLPTP
jgi:hypothetical protein